jgi:magnesium transporter
MENENTFEKNFGENFIEIVENIIFLLNSKKYVAARDALLKNNEVDIAEILEEVLEELGIEKTVIIFRTLPKDIAVEVFSYLPVEDQVAIINVITDKEIRYILDELDFDDMIDVLEELPANLVDKILEKTPKEERKLINTFLNYPDTCAGSLMTPYYISLNKNMTVDQALAHIKNEGMDSETIYTCYVKEMGRKLLGIVSLRILVVSKSDAKIEDLMHTEFICVNVRDDQEVVSEAFKKYGFLAIPVVDNEARLVGIITVDDILDVIEEETTEDFQRMAGVIDSGDAEYLDISVWKHVKNRLPWLFILMCSYVITGGIISSFENVLSQVISLVAYLPMLMGTGGNSGSQSATLIIRGMALGDVELRDAGKVLWKEVRISFIIGMILSLLNFARICWLDGEGPWIGLAVCSSMLIIVMAAKSIGSMLPMAAKKVGIDPALMASPMIASITDMISVVTYFLLATLILGL